MGYEESSTHAFLVALREVAPALPASLDGVSGPHAKLQCAKRRGRKAIAEIVIPAWKLLASWRKSAEPIRLEASAPTSARVLSGGFSGGPFGFCYNLGMGMAQTFGVALGALREVEELSAVLAEGDRLAHEVLSISKQMVFDEAYQMALNAVGEAARNNPVFIARATQAAELVIERVHGRDSVGRYEQYLFEEVGPALHFIGGLAFVGLVHLENRGVPFNERLKRCSRLLANAIPFVRDWALLSTGGFTLLTRPLAYRTPTSASYVAAGSLLKPEAFAIAAFGTELEHLAFSEQLLNYQPTFEAQLRKHNQYRIGCGGLGIKPEAANVVADCVIWAQEVIDIHGHYMCELRDH